jgi:hypothetical protein
MTTTPHTLSRGSRRTMATLAEVVMPKGAGAPEVPIANVLALVESFCREMPRLLRVLFPIGLFLLEWGALVLGPSLVPFSWMSPERRQRYVMSWVHSGSHIRRDLIKGVKGLVLICYYSDPRVGAFLGYAVDEHVQLVKAERLKRHAV